MIENAQPSISWQTWQVTLRIINRSLRGLGQAYSPPGDGPFPTVLVLHGSEGTWSGYSYLNAAILAAHGFLAVPFGYSVGGNAWNAGNILDVPLDRTAEALSALHACRSQARWGYTAYPEAPSTPCLSPH